MNKVEFTVTTTVRRCWLEVAYTVVDVKVAQDVDERGPYIYLCDWRIESILAWSDRKDMFFPVTDRLRKVLEEKDIEYQLRENIYWRKRGGDE